MGWEDSWWGWVGYQSNDNVREGLGKGREEGRKEAGGNEMTGEENG